MRASEVIHILCEIIKDQGDLPCDIVIEVPIPGKHEDNISCMETPLQSIHTYKGVIKISNHTKGNKEAKLIE
jgi:hypothetical protein